MNQFGIKEIKFKYRGKPYSANIAIPSNLKQAIDVLGDDEVMRCFIFGYLEDQKKKIRTKRVKKFAKISLTSLSDEQKEGLKALGLL